jgi:hypothetical protein
MHTHAVSRSTHTHTQTHTHYIYKAHPKCTPQCARTESVPMKRCTLTMNALSCLRVRPIKVDYIPAQRRRRVGVSCVRVGRRALLNTPPLLRALLTRLITGHDNRRLVHLIRHRSHGYLSTGKHWERNQTQKNEPRSFACHPCVWHVMPVALFAVYLSVRLHVCASPVLGTI